MIARCTAILLLALLTVLPAVGEASAVPTAMHCAPVAHTVTMAMPQGHDHAAGNHGCEHRSSHHQQPCAMMGLCTMTGCMAIVGIATPQLLASGQRVAFLVPALPRLDGLALAPPLEPPRA